MDVGVIITIIVFFAQFLGTIFAMGHFFGKNSDRLSNVETIQEGVRMEYLRMNKDIHEGKEDIQEVKKDLAVIKAELSGDIGSASKEIKELKESFNDFTKEMRAWRYEIVKNKK